MQARWRFDYVTFSTCRYRLEHVQQNGNKQTSHRFIKKGSRLELDNYRPVSLTSIVCKVLDKIIRDAIMIHLTSNNLLSEKQHCFVNGKACVTNLLETIDFLTKRFCANIPIGIIFIDYLKEFDLVAH